MLPESNTGLYSVKVRIHTFLGYIFNAMIKHIRSEAMSKSIANHRICVLLKCIMLNGKKELKRPKLSNNEVVASDK